MAEAVCAFCGRKISEKKDYRIITARKFGVRFKASHERCFKEYEKKDPKKGLPATLILNGKVGYAAMALLGGFSSMIAILICTRPEAKGYLFLLGPLFLIPFGLAVYLVSVRMYFLMRFEWEQEGME